MLPVADPGKGHWRGVSEWMDGQRDRDETKEHPEGGLDRWGRHASFSRSPWAQ